MARNLLDSFSFLTRFSEFHFHWKFESLHPCSLSKSLHRARTPTSSDRARNPGGWSTWSEDGLSPALPWQYGYGSIPISTIFSGLFTSINPSYFGVHQGYKVLTHPHIDFYWISYNEIYWHHIDIYWIIILDPSIENRWDKNGGVEHQRHCSTARGWLCSADTGAGPSLESWGRNLGKKY